MISTELGHIIHQQLSTDQLVVLPRFGGFLMDPVAAELDELRNRIQPPKNSVVFNTRLVHNDGLLIATIAETKGISYAKADVWLTDAVSELRFRLENEETVIWAGLGNLKKSAEGAFEFKFEDDGSLQDDFYGLKPLSLLPVEEDNVDKVRKLVAADGLVARSVRTIPLKKVARYAAAAIAVGFLVWMPIQKGALNNGKMLVSQLNPFVVNSAAVYSPRTFSDAWLSKGFEKKDVLAEKYQQEYLSVSLTNNSKHSIVVKTDAIPSEEASFDEEPILESANSYMVIAATFNSKKKATNYVSDMKKRGFGAEYAGKDNSGYLVAYGSYNSLQDAQKMLASVNLSNKEARIVSGN